MKILLHPLLLLLAPYAIEAILEPDLDRFIVRYKNEQGKSSAKAAAQKVHVDLEPQNALAVTLSSEALEGLQSNPNIEYVEQDSPRYTMMMRGCLSKDDILKENIPNNNKETQITETVPYGIPMVQADQVPYDSRKPRTICLIDTGYDLGHEDLPSTNSTVDGYDGGNLAWNEDGTSHGTHVAGTIAAISVNGVVGVAPGVNLFIVRVFDDNGVWTYASNLVDAAYRCKAGGANVISMSLGHPGFHITENSAFADLFSSNILIVAAAGNWGSTDLIYPASYDSVVSVAAVDSDKNVPSFSQRNAHVEIAAPGVSILSTFVMGRGDVQCNYGYKSGTSMATPHVSGVAALIWSHDTTKRASEVRAALQGGAQDLGDNGKDNSTGYGLVQAAAACANLTGSYCELSDLASEAPSPGPSLGPSMRPSLRPSLQPSFSSRPPSGSPSEQPSFGPSVSSSPPTSVSSEPSLRPSFSSRPPSGSPSEESSSPSDVSMRPSMRPSLQPSLSSRSPSGSPSEQPSFSPSVSSPSSVSFEASTGPSLLSSPPVGPPTEGLALSHDTVPSNLRPPQPFLAGCILDSDCLSNNCKNLVCRSSPTSRANKMKMSGNRGGRGGGGAV